jgi:hypothetical protein
MTLPPLEFTLLIGSCARGTPEPASDVDVVRIGHVRSVLRGDLGKRVGRACGPLNCIDYTEIGFLSLHAAGSLFIRHILFEGILIEGSSTNWLRLKSEFVGATDFGREISRHRQLATWLLTSPSFTDATMPRLSHLFRVLKNWAIFSLAQRDVYEFDKMNALSSAFPGLEHSDRAALSDAYNAYERGIALTRGLVSSAKPGELQRMCVRLGLAIREID